VIGLAPILVGGGPIYGTGRIVPVRSKVVEFLGASALPVSFAYMSRLVIDSSGFHNERVTSQS
jgi:hypothetical protein